MREAITTFPGKKFKSFDFARFIFDDQNLKIVPGADGDMGSYTLIDNAAPRDLTNFWSLKDCLERISQRP